MIQPPNMVCQVVTFPAKRHTLRCTKLQSLPSLRWSLMILHIEGFRFLSQNMTSSLLTEQYSRHQRSHFILWRLQFPENISAPMTNDPLHTGLIPFDGRNESALVQPSWIKILPVSETANAARYTLEHCLLSGSVWNTRIDKTLPQTPTTEK